MKNLARTRPGPGRLATALALLTVPGLLAGCSAAASSVTSGPPAVMVTPTPLAPAQLSVPTLGYEPTMGQTVAVTRAVTTLAGRCVRSYGLRAPAGNLLIVAPISDISVLQIQVGWLSLASARRYGYYPPPSELDQQLVELARQAYTAGATAPPAAAPGLAGVLHGAPGAQENGRPVPAGGCVGRAERALGDVGLLYRGQADVASQVFRDAVLEMRQDPRVLSVIRRWRSCMRARGFRYQSPDAAQLDPRWAAEGTPVAEIARTRPLQVAVATSDARCRAQLDYPGIRLGVLRAYLRRSMGAHAGQLGQYRRRLARLVARARAVLDGGQP